VNLLAHSRSFSGVMSRGLKMTPSINSFLNPSMVFNPSLKPCCANSFTSRSRTLPQCARSLKAFSPEFDRNASDAEMLRSGMPRPARCHEFHRLRRRHRVLSPTIERPKTRPNRPSFIDRHTHGSFRDFAFLFWATKENDDDDFCSSLFLIVLTCS
jgi:hypothetical protein